MGLMLQSKASFERAKPRIKDLLPAFRMQTMPSRSATETGMVIHVEWVPTRPNMTIAVDAEGDDDFGPGVDGEGGAGQQRRPRHPALPQRIARGSV